MSCFHDTPSTRFAPQVAPDQAACNAAAGRRRKLWEIRSSLLCSLVGTCLTLGDLRRIERRLKIDQLQTASDFHVHGTFVVWAAQPGPVAKQMHKLLERRYMVAVRRFAAASSIDDLTASWATSLDDGDVPGPYWALLTHPLASEALMMRAFGEVHMLSHVMGAANRGDTRRLLAMERERDAVADVLAAVKQRLLEREREMRQLADCHAADVRDLQARLVGEEDVAAHLQHTEVWLRNLESGAAMHALRQELVAVGDKVHAEADELARQDALMAKLECEQTRLQQAATEAEGTVRAIAVECEATERLVRARLASLADEVADDDENDVAINLSGQRIVYVGGRGSTIPHLRAVVERFGGVFLHHDGGMEERNTRLDRILDQGDAVFCPVDCISHDACMRAKRHCRQRASAFVPLRSCSLSSFLQGLRQLAQGAAD